MDALRGTACGFVREPVHTTMAIQLRSYAKTLAGVAILVITLIACSKPDGKQAEVSPLAANEPTFLDEARAIHEACPS